VEEKKARAGGCNVKHGRQNLLIPFNEILGFYSEEGYSVLVTRENKKYFPDKSLDKIEQTLPAEIFYRVNRQYIVHRNEVKGFKRADNGKLDVLVNGAGDFPGTLALSRTKAAGFKNWFQAIES
jgi:DNA-binding LytR/AlgR family response regulator